MQRPRHDGGGTSSRTGGYAANNPGEVAAWSTADRVPRTSPTGRHELELVLDSALDPLYEATVDVVEERLSMRSAPASN